jgi:hypothetical protein
MMWRSNPPTTYFTRKITERITIGLMSGLEGAALEQGWQNFLTARAKISDNFPRILSSAHWNFEQQNGVLESSIIINDYSIYCKYILLLTGGSRGLSTPDGPERAVTAHAQTYSLDLLQDTLVMAATRQTASDG